jgi:hypothetical protein
MPDVTEWPFGTDADRDDPLTEHRIAVTSSHPGWAFLVAFDRESEDRPTVAEVAMLRSFLDEYMAYWYRPGFVQQTQARPLDVDGGANGVVFHKYGPDDWGYRKQSWESGPLFVPQHPQIRHTHPLREGAPVGPIGLTEVMDFVHTIGDGKPMPRWLEWKAKHPEVFGEVAR